MMDRGMEVTADRPCEIRQPTIRESLVQEKDRLTRQMASVDAAIAALDQNPGFEVVHDAVVKAGIGMRLR